MRNFTDDWMRLVGVFVTVMLAAVGVFVVIAAVVALFH
jgi:hypothetical protein